MAHLYWISPLKMVDLSIVTVVYQRVHVTCSTCFQPSALSQTPGKITPLHGFAGAKHPLSCHRSSAHSVSHCVWSLTKECQRTQWYPSSHPFPLHNCTWFCTHMDLKDKRTDIQNANRSPCSYNLSLFHTHTHAYIHIYIYIYISIYHM